MGGGGWMIAGRPASKLFSKTEDPYKLHATCGVLSLLHAAYRIFLWMREGTMGFDGTWATLLSLAPHAALALSSVFFSLPTKRNKAVPALYPEMREHAIVFSLRSIVMMVLQWLHFRTHYAPLLYLRGLAVVLAQALADRATERHRAAGNSSTVRGIPFPPATPPPLIKAAHFFYSFSQLMATLMFVCYRLDTAFSVLVVVQLSAFFMTLCRKGIFSCAAWHVGYVLLLLHVFAIHFCSSPVFIDMEPPAGRRASAALEAEPRLLVMYYIIPTAFAVAAARFGPLKLSKKKIWGSLVLAHWAAMRFCRTLDATAR